jgi:hypothetical protein
VGFAATRRLLEVEDSLGRAAEPDMLEALDSKDLA